MPSSAVLPEYYVYAFVREDISDVGKIVQVGHACLLAGKEFQTPDYHTLVLISLPDEEAILETQVSLELKGIRSRSFFEPDYKLGTTALVTEPVSSEDRKFFRKYCLHK